MELSATSSTFTNRYQIQSLVGEGGAGSVYCAWDPQLARTVAVKRLKTDALSPKVSQAALQEATRLAAFHHPNIVAVYDFVCNEDDAYLVMEFIEGETVDQVLTRGVFPLEEFVHLAEQCLEGLIAAHHIGLIHRDIKPANIMLTWLPSGAFQVKILDLGLAKFISAPSAQTVAVDGSVMGSILTMAPEQFTKSEIDARTDMYSLGCVFYTALTGATPYTGETAAEVIAAHLQGNATPIPVLRPDLPAALCDWVARLFALRPEDRFASCGDALIALREVTSGKAVEGSLNAEQKSAAPRKLRSAMRIPAAVGVVMAVGVVLWLSLSWPKTGATPQSLPENAGGASPRPEVFDPHDLVGLRAHVDQQVTIEGLTVSGVKDKTLNVRRLSFDSDGNKALTLVFPLDSGGHFSKEAIGAYVGKRVRTSGVVEDDHGALQIVIKSLGQLMLVEQAGR